VYETQGGEARSCGPTCDKYHDLREEAQENSDNLRAFQEAAEARRRELI
jgi:hypothetical protein